MNRDSSKILVVENLVKYYGEGENQVRAVDHTGNREGKIYGNRRPLRLRKVYASALDWRLGQTG